MFLSSTELNVDFRLQLQMCLNSLFVLVLFGLRFNRSARFALRFPLPEPTIMGAIGIEPTLLSGAFPCSRLTLFQRPMSSRPSSSRPSVIRVRKSLPSSKIRKKERFVRSITCTINLGACREGFSHLDASISKFL
jgi:hypothetical protein